MRHLLNFDLSFFVITVFSLSILSGFYVSEPVGSSTGSSSSALNGSTNFSTDSSIESSSTLSGSTNSSADSVTGSSSTLSGSTNSSTESSSTLSGSTSSSTGSSSKPTFFSTSTIEKTITTTESFDPCASNPCLNEGTCLKNTNNYSCDCRYGFVGINCEELNYCKYNFVNYTSGDEYCRDNNATCVPNNKTKYFSCSCNVNSTYFDYNEETCKGIITCLYEGCDMYETCDTQEDKCVCKEDYERSNDTSPCVGKNFCAEFCDNPNEECKRGPEDNPRNINCTCKNGYARNKNTKYCEATFCETGSNNCSENEVCKTTNSTKGYICECNDPFNKIKDKCVLPNRTECVNSTLNCGEGGECVKINDIQWCICNKGYILENKTCVGKSSN
ncbi:neurogenic locus notch homolog protein 1-like isoform X2 [Limulus polyphemus]|uniref:Neurogenic locus notch homolog protein 1-like isoform X2 n=1 Tax=Limulus polyphemus TaxID=6850 RepID=A0ABM1RY69_LIMPO|nr:neurogenic locus notch homolog protein 1-like isoform X2 [Limulus polyphemus]